MVMKKEQVEQICNYVHDQPRTIQEISKLIGSSWVTADRYVRAIAESDGSINMRTFRGGTRGALKIVYWVNTEVIGSQVQTRLMKQIESGRSKFDFSPSEIYQYIEPGKKEARIMPCEQYNSKRNFNKFKSHLMQAKEQVMFFSGNLTFSNIGNHDKKILDLVEELARSGIDFKILTGVDLKGINNIKNILALNDRIGRNAIQVRHCYQPLRATIIDDHLIHFKETKLQVESQAPKDELPEDLHIVYEIRDEKWVAWMQKVFWKFFRSSADASRRIEDFEAMTRW
jgi:hypothetical protein